MSLRDVGIGGSGSYERGVRHRVRDRARNTQDRERQQRGQGELTRPSTATDAASQARQIEHQSSLRSLLSSSDVDSSEMEEEILRQIMDEGILDGIDLNNIDVSQEDELSERIADAYRRRHTQRSRARAARAESSDPAISREHRSPQERQYRRSGRSPNTTDQNSQSSHPPLSRPHLLEVYPTGQGHRRRTSSETRRHTSPASGGRVSSETQRPAARSATDLTTGSTSSSSRREHPQSLSNSSRRTTDPENLRPRGKSQDSVGRPPRSPGSRSRNISSRNGSQVSATERPPSLRTDIESSPQDQSQTSVRTTDQQSYFYEPPMVCDRCGKSDIGYELHWNCATCHEGHYNLCLSCYRSGRGCLHWFGFGHAAVQRYRTQEPASGYPPNHPLPHRLEGRCYLHPLKSIMTALGNTGRTSNLDERFLSGPFCSNCLTYTPNCYWKCEICNEGEWGFCNSCVNWGRCCTHALLPLKYLEPQALVSSPPPTSPQAPPFTSNDISTASRDQLNMIDSVHRERYTALAIGTKCDICTYPIPPSITRFHCPHCNVGNYDIDTTCYHRLIRSGKISAENGPQGWRRCPDGHRMIIVGFEDSDVGQRRIVVADLVGGHALKDDKVEVNRAEWSWRDEQQTHVKPVSRTATGRKNAATEISVNDKTPPLLKQYPPNGGVGMQVLALWSWWPQEGAKDELAFPKGAEIRECEDINGDWFWGIYSGRKGLFPSNYGRVIGSTA